MESLETFSEHLQLTQETELLELDVAQQSVRLRQMQRVQEQRAVDGNLMWLTHWLRPFFAHARTGGAL
jgi:hypothetical protein